MSSTPNLDLPYILPSQAQKHVTHNEAIRALDAVVQLAVLDRDLREPPGSPSNGDRYIIASDGTSDWLGHDLKIAAYQDGAWAILTPREGWQVWVSDEGSHLTWDGAGWVAPGGSGDETVVSLSPFGAKTSAAVLEEELETASGNAVDSIIQIPNRAIVLGVSTRTTQTVTGATSYNCGISGESSKFGGFLGVGAGSTNAGVIGPTAFYSPTPVRLTANDANFSGGRVRIAIHYLLCEVPAS